MKGKKNKRGFPLIGSWWSMKVIVFFMFYLSDTHLVGGNFSKKGERCCGCKKMRPDSVEDRSILSQKVKISGKQNSIWAKKTKQKVLQCRGKQRREKMKRRVSLRWMSFHKKADNFEEHLRSVVKPLSHSGSFSVWRRVINSTADHY